MKTVQTSFLSVGYLRNAVTLLKNVKQISKEKKVSYHTLLEIINTGDLSREGTTLVLDYLIELQILVLIESSQSSNHVEIFVEVSKKIAEVLDKEREVINREMLWNYIEKIIPTWTRYLKHGIEKTKSGISDTNVKQTFRENGLFIDLEIHADSQIMDWWNRAKQFSRQIEQSRKVEIGDHGELLTLEFETQRTSKKPKHVSLQSDSYGYDIISIINQNNEEELFIEVKTTSSGWNNGYIHISSNEASKCEKLNSNYKFYLWNIRTKPFELKIIEGKEMFVFFPLNQESGKWESVKIPLKEFNDSKVIQYPAMQKKG